MEASVVVLLSTLFCHCVSAAELSHFAALFPTPSDDVAVQFGRSVIIPFDWMGTDPFQICHYMRNETVKQFIYINGKTMIGDGFTVRQNKTGRYELLIDTVRHDHAGVYDLIVSGSVASRRCLTVISGPRCIAERSSSLHEAHYHCSLQHTGPAQPSMDWPELGECSETDTTNTYNNAGLNIRKSSCMVAVPQTNEYLLHHSKTCILSLIDANKQKLRQTYTCTITMPRTTTYTHHWAHVSDRMYLRLGHIMYLVLSGLFLFIIYCVRSPLMWMLIRLRKWCSCLLSRGTSIHNSNGRKQESYVFNTTLQVIDNC